MRRLATVVLASLFGTFAFGQITPVASVTRTPLASWDLKFTKAVAMANGNVVVIGTRQTPGDDRSKRGYIMCVTPTGSVVWARVFEGTPTHPGLKFDDVRVTRPNGIDLVTVSGSGDCAFYARILADFGTVMERRWANRATEDSAVDPDGNTVYLDRTYFERPVTYKEAFNQFDGIERTTFIRTFIGRPGFGFSEANFNLPFQWIDYDYNVTNLLTEQPSGRLARSRVIDKFKFMFGPDSVLGWPSTYLVGLGTVTETPFNQTARQGPFFAFSRFTGLMTFPANNSVMRDLPAGTSWNDAQIGFGKKDQLAFRYWSAGGWTTESFNERTLAPDASTIFSDPILHERTTSGNFTIGSGEHSSGGVASKMHNNGTFTYQKTGGDFGGDQNIFLDVTPSPGSVLVKRILKWNGNQVDASNRNIPGFEYGDSVIGTGGQLFFVGKIGNAGVVRIFAQSAIAFSNTYTVPAGAPFSGQNVLSNDFYTQGATCQVVASPANGNLVLNPDGSFTYTPNPGFTGQDQFTYFVQSGPSNSLSSKTVPVILNVQ